jgi:hypothetical protein
VSAPKWFSAPSPTSDHRNFTTPIGYYARGRRIEDEARPGLAANAEESLVDGVHAAAPPWFTLRAAYPDLKIGRARPSKIGRNEPWRLRQREEIQGSLAWRCGRVPVGDDVNGRGLARRRTASRSFFVELGEAKPHEISRAPIERSSERPGTTPHRVRTFAPTRIDVDGRRPSPIAPPFRGGGSNEKDV